MRSLPYSVLLLTLGIALFVPVSASPAHAAGSIITVTSTDSGTGGAECTLRAAIAAANTSALVGGCDGSGGAPFTIVLAPNATYTLTEVDNTDLSGYQSALPIFYNDMTIEGNGATIQRDANAPPMSLVVIYSNTLTLNNLVLRGASTAGLNGAGGAVFVYGGKVNINNSTITGNTADDSGGGLANSGIATITDSTLSDNQARVGGAISNNGTLIVRNSTLTGNRSEQGGGIYSRGLLELTNSTLYGNRAESGGALAIAAGSAVIVNSSLERNSASDKGAAIATDVDGVTIKNSLLAVNMGSGNCSGQAIAGQSNLSDDATCGANFAVTSAAGIALGALADNGGSTWTVAPGARSAAVDAGDDAICLAAAGVPQYGAGGKDQRGVDRPQGEHCDIGAVEVKLPSATEPVNPPVAPPLAPPRAPTATPPTAQPTTPTTEQTCPNPYIVQRGDWIYKIARQCGVSPFALITANRLPNPNCIYVGQVLRIPK